MSLLRLALLAPGVAALAAVLVSDSLRRPDGWPRPEAWTLTVFAVAGILCASAWRTRWQRTGLLLALALVGQACALALRDSPPYNVLEHYHPWREIATWPRALLLLGPLVQTAVVLRAGGAGRIVGLLSPGRALLLALVVAFTAANGSQDVARYLAELGLALWILAANLWNFVLVAAAIPRDALEAARSRLAGPLGASRPGGGGERLRWWIALWVSGVSAAISWFVFEGMPHVTDSISYLFQAKYFAAGHLYLPPPPDADSFALYQTVIDENRWYGYGSPAWPAVLALGVLAGAPWLVNPLLSGLTVLAFHALLRRLYDARTATAGALLLAVSPWFLFMGASFLNHTLGALLTVAALLSITKLREGHRAPWAVLAGVSMGALFLTRPLDAALVAGPVGLWCLGWGAPRLPWRWLGVAGACGLAVASAVLPYNRALTGSATVFPLYTFTDATNAPGADRLGFGPEIGNRNWPHLDPLPGHGPIDIVINANQNLYMTSFELFGWAFGSLGFAFLAILWGRWRGPDGLMLGIVVAVAGGHGFYWFSGGPDIGARYWYQCLLPLVALTLSGIREAQRRWAERGGVPGRVVGLVVAASVVAFVNVVPVRILGKYHNYRGFRREAAALMSRHDFGRSLVFVREGHKSDYASVAIFNPVLFEGDVPIFVRELDAAHRERVQRAFPDRSVWLVRGSPTPEAAFEGAPFTVLEGPLPPPADGSP